MQMGASDKILGFKIHCNTLTEMRKTELIQQFTSISQINSHFQPEIEIALLLALFPTTILNVMLWNIWATIRWNFKI